MRTFASLAAALALASHAAAASSSSSSPSRPSTPIGSRDGLSGPLTVDPALDCGIRQLAYNYSASLMPERLPLQSVFDALRLGSECNVSNPSASPSAPVPLPRPAGPTSAPAATYYADPVNGDDTNGDGSLAKPFRTVGRAVLASRAGPRPPLISLRAGTFYLPEPLLLTSADNNLTLASYPGDEPAVLSAGVPLTGLSWSPYNVESGLSGPFGATTNVGSCVNAPGESSSECSYNGTTPDAATCAGNCLANSTCTSYTWHDSTNGPYSLDCYFRIDGVWNPSGQAGHVSGQKRTLNIYSASLAGVPGLDLASFDTLFFNNRRAVLARYPNGNPEVDQTPVGFTYAKSWVAPTPPASPAEEIHIQAPSRPEDPFFPNFQLGVGGTVASFDPPESFWATASPPAGNQYVVPSGLVYDPSSFSPAVVNWTHPERARVHAFHSGHWGDWAFTVGTLNTTTNTLTFSAGGWQEARGSSSGAEYYVENVLQEIDAALEWYVDTDTATLYLNFNSTGAPDPSTFTLLAAQLTNAITIAGGDGISGEPAVGVTIANLTIGHTRTTFMLPYEVPSGGDWSMYRGGAIVLEGTEDAAILGCTVYSPGGNGIIVSAYNRRATIAYTEVVYAGESACVVAGKTELIDATAGNFPSDTLIAYNLFHELGLYTKQSGGVYQALANATTVLGTAIFNTPRAAINFNDGMCGGHLIRNVVGFNTVRETSDHGVFNSWDRQPYLCGAGDTSLLPAETLIDQNLLIGNYRVDWSIDSDDGSNSYLQTRNVIPWCGFKTYLGFFKKSIGNLYIYPEAGISTEGEGRRSYGAAPPTPAVGGGSWPNCLMAYGTSVLPSSLLDTWQNNTCITGTGSNIYALPGCNPKNVTDGNTPLLSGNTFMTADGQYSLKCGGQTWTTLAEAQAAGAEVGSTLTGSVPTTPEILAMAAALLGM